MKNIYWIGVGFLASCLSLVGQANTIQDTRAALDQWAETQRILSETKNNWEFEKSILQDSEAFLSSESARLDDILKNLDERKTAADEERSTLANEKEVLSAASAVVNKKIGLLETKVKAVVKTFPEPLVDRIKPLIRRLPDDPNQTKLTLGERVQNIVGILSQADKFNGSITHTSESREIEGSGTIEVRTIYWGLAGAYFVDAAGVYAGVGFPEEDGWTWSPVEGAGPAIKRLLDVYEGTGEIQFVEVPARIQ